MTAPARTMPAHGFPPITYASSAGSAISHRARSARWPSAIVPRSARPRARAAFLVTPASASSGVRRNNVHAKFSISTSEITGDVPGLQSVATAIGTPCARSVRDRRHPRFAQDVKGAGQHHGDRTRTRERRHARIVRVFEMIDRQRAEFGGQRGAPRIGQLVGVQLDRQSMRARRLEYAPRLRGREGNALAERIDGVGQTLARRRSGSSRGRRGRRSHRRGPRIPAARHVRQAASCEHRRRRPRQANAPPAESCARWPCRDRSRT